MKFLGKKLDVSNQGYKITKKMYCLKNRVADEAIGSPFLANNDLHAIQQVEMDFRKNPIDIDIDLYYLGDFDFHDMKIINPQTVQIWTSEIDVENTPVAK